MPENKLTPEQHQWAQKVYRHLQWKFPLVEGDPHEDDELEEIPLDDVELNTSSLSNTEDAVEEPVSELEARKKAHDAELSSLYKRLKRIRKSIEVAGKRSKVFTEEDETQDLFEAAKALGEEQIALATEVSGQKDQDGFHDLAAIKGHLDKADHYLKTMQAAYQKGQGTAVEELEDLKKTAARYQQRVEELHKERAPLTNWSVDLSAVDSAYSAALDNFTEMNRAISGYVVSEVNRTLDVAKEKLAQLKEATDSAKRYADASGTELLLKVSIAERTIKDLTEQSITLDDTPDQLGAFNKAHDEAVVEAKKANDAVLGKRGRDCESALTKADKAISQMQQVLLLARTAAAESEFAPSDDVDETFLQQLADDVSRQEKIVDELNSQRDLVKNHGINYPSFEAAYQSAQTAILGAQAALLARNGFSAQASIHDVRDAAEDLKDYIAEAESALEVLAEQIRDLRRALEPLADKRRDFEKYAQADEKFGGKQLGRFDAVCAEVSALIDYAEVCMQGQRVEEADQAVGNSRNGLKRLEKEAKSLLWMPQVSSAATEDEAREMLEKAIARVRADVQDYDKMRSVFRDNEELKIYAHLLDKAADYVSQAEDQLVRKRFANAEDALDNARVTLDSMEIAYERGADTAAKVEGFLADVEAAKDRIAAVYEQGMALQNPDHKNDFLSYNSIATDFAFQVEGLIAEGRVKDARAILSNLKVALANLERCVTQKPPKKKKAKAEPKATEAPVQEQEVQAEAVDPKAAEQKELGQQLDQIRNAINTIFSQARPHCVDEYVKDLEEAYASAMQQQEEASAALTTGDLEGARASSSAAKQVLSVMQTIQDNSRQILTSLLNGLSEGATYYDTLISGIYQKRAEFDDWSVDLAQFDNAHNRAQETLRNLHKATKDQIAEHAKTLLDKLEDDKQALEEAYAETCENRDMLRSDLIIQVSDKQSELSQLFAQQYRFDGNEALLERFTKQHAMALICAQVMLDNLKAENGKEVENQFAKFDECVANLKEMLKEAPLPSAENQTPEIDEDESISIGIEQTYRQLKSFGKRKDLFKNKEDLAEFNALVKEVETYLQEAEAQLGGRDAKSAFDKVEAAMENVRAAFERGQRTAATLEAYQIKVEELTDTINQLFGQRGVIQDDDDMAIFVDHNETASEAAYKIESFLKNGKITEAEVQFGFLRSLIASMERILKQQVTKQRKGIFKRRGAVRHGKKK